MESAAAGTSVRLSKGAHLLLEAEGDGRSALTTPLPNGRVSFAIPWEGMLLLGTTDEPFEGDPAAVTATDDDQRQILAEASLSLEPWLLDQARVRSRFAGVRVLPEASRSTARIRRETVIRRGPAGMVSVAGGKLTTWHAIGRRAAAMALADIGRSAPPCRAAPLPGAAQPTEIDAALARAWPRPRCGHPGRPRPPLWHRCARSAGACPGAAGVARADRPHRPGHLGAAAACRWPRVGGNRRRRIATTHHGRLSRAGRRRRARPGDRAAGER